MRTLLFGLVLLTLPAFGADVEVAQPVENATATPPVEAAPSPEAKPAETASPPAVAPAEAAPPPAAKPAEATTVPSPNLPPKTGSQVKPDDNFCVQCHQEQDPNDPVTKRLCIDLKTLEEDVHWKKGVNCHDCHGGDYQTPQVNEAHAKENGFRGAGQAAREICAACHKSESIDILKGVHDKAGEKNERGQGAPLACGKCHGDNPHHLLPVHDKQSPVFLDNQVQTCGGCHAAFLETYSKSMHGQGLTKLGLLVTATCADCHGSHAIYRAPDRRSSLHATQVATTCGKCHRFIEERLRKSVHGSGNGPGEMVELAVPGGKMRRTPSCTDCHQGHDLLDPESTDFRVQLPNRCGNCHANLSGRYAMSLHGALNKLGYGPAAKCSDCHGSHDILPLSNPASHLAGENRVETCKKCHVHANQNFSTFDPHADPHDPEANPILYLVFLGMEALLFSVFGFFGIHTLLWFTRSLIHALMYGRPKKLAPQQQAYLRFEPIHRVLHVVVIVSFLGLALTGLPLKYNNQDWAKTLASLLGGFDRTSTLHRICALATVYYASAHLVWLGRKIAEMRRQAVPWKTVVFGPDSPVPNIRDVKDFFRMAGWFFGLAKKPVFERWSYWEKFDYWAVFWGIGIIGTSGLMLWFPNFFTCFVPGGILNGAKLIHSEEALLATGFIFAIHFFNTHFRAEKFPLDSVIFTGAISEAELKEERPEYLDRLRSEGRLEQLRTTMPSRTRVWLIMLGGTLALATGLALLVAMVLAGLGH